ncbi:putative disease resistance protein RGA3 [Hibiscus syriacus]|uniref:putative disease resistance protein RGA3 n=1 Tax=Hibiscus syriacus TaxID=106335 RepID=UPI0019210022|nr:putative disease resistance protein RGA3 [Hibiscus syriacus]
MGSILVCQKCQMLSFPCASNRSSLVDTPVPTTDDKENPSPGISQMDTIQSALNQIQVFPYEDKIDNTEFSIFFSMKEALEAGYLVNQLHQFPKDQWLGMWNRLKNVSIISSSRQYFPPKKEDAESRIVITTCEHKFAVETKSTYIFHLKELPGELCWMILCEVALNGLNEDSHECVEDIGLEIAKKCKGSPFAAKVLGGVLQHKIEKREWNSVLENYIWESPMIPKNGGIHTWKMHNIVHDFLRFLFQYELMMEIRSVEHMMLDLTSARTSKEVKSIKRVIPAPAPKQMKTLSDSGTSILASYCDPPLILDSSCPPLPSDFPLISIRHLMVMIAQGVGFPVDISGAEKLRTLVAVSQGCLITSRALSNLCKQSKHLRLLDLSLSSGWHNCFGPCGQGNVLRKFPEEIYELINLKFLSLAGSKELKILPETLCDLYDLQSLDLTGCSSLTKLPDGIGKLMRLRYLYTWYCCSITFYPKGIGCLTSLRELTNVIVRVDQNDAKEFSLGDFEELNHLCGDVRVKLVGNAIDADEAIRANLSNKKSLSNVRINLDGDIKEDDVIKALKPPSELKIEFIGGWF